MSTAKRTRRNMMPAELERRMAHHSGLALAAALAQHHACTEIGLRLRTSESGGPEIAIPLAAARMLVGILEQMGNGNDVALVAVDSELTTQQAADLIRVSRPFLIAMLEKGAIAFHRVGAHRRILARDVLQYMERERARRERVMEELVAETERLGLYE